MHKYFILLALICIWNVTISSGKLYAQKIENLEYEVVASIPTPGPHLCGLEWKDGYLWAADDSTDMIYKINPQTGEAVSTIPSPFPDPKGLAWHKGNLVLFDFKKIQLVTMDVTGKVIAVLDTLINQSDNVDIIPELKRGEYTVGKGIASDGEYIWIAYYLGYSSKIFRVDPETGIIDKWFFAWVEDLEFDSTYLWTVQQNGHHKGYVYKREIPSGKGIARFETSGENASGMAINHEDTQDIWVTDTVLNMIECQRLKTITHISETSEYPKRFILGQNYPNPFNATTTIEYTVLSPGQIELTIFDIHGQNIINLVHERKETGKYSVVWNGKDKYGRDVASGAYNYVLLSGSRSGTKRIIFLK